MRIIEKFKIIAITVTMLTGVGVSSVVLNHQVTCDEIRVKNFYQEKKDSLDMVVIGASTAFTDYSAPLTWNQYGITSYSLATNMAPMSLAKSMLIEARKTQNPKLYVIDINGVLYSDALETKEGSLRLWIDNMPFSENKIKTINELIPSDQRMYYYLPILKYHSNWEKLLSCLNITKKNIETKLNPINLSISGMEGWAKIDPQRNVVDVTNYTKTSQMYKESGKHLIELLEYCKAEGLTNVVFTNMPRYYNDTMYDQKEVVNAAKAKIAEYGYTCYDFDNNVKEIGLDPLTDFYNTNHLNIYGQKKFTMYMVETLMKDYDIKGEHSQETIDKWNQEYDTYEKLYQWADDKIKNKDYQKYDYDTIDSLINE